MARTDLYQIAEPQTLREFEWVMGFPHDWHRDLISDFVASIQQQRPSRTHGGEALQTHQLIDDLLAAAGPVIDL